MGISLEKRTLIGSVNTDFALGIELNPNGVLFVLAQQWTGLNYTNAAFSTFLYKLSPSNLQVDKSLNISGNGPDATSVGANGDQLAKYRDGFLAPSVDKISNQLYLQSFDHSGEWKDYKNVIYNGTPLTVGTPNIIQASDDGSVYFFGYTGASLSGIPNLSGGLTPYLFKTNLNGEVSWATLFDQSIKQARSNQDLVIDKDESVYLAINKQLLKFSKDGEILWRTQLAQITSEHQSLSLTSDGGLILSTTNTLKKFSSLNGQEIWSYVPVSSDIKLADVCEGANGEIFLIAIGQEFMSGETYIHRLNNEGKFLESVRLDIVSNDEYYITFDKASSSLYVAGRMWDTVDHKGLIFKGGRLDIYVQKYEVTEFPMYTLASSLTSVNEGSIALFSVSTTGVSAGTSLAYSLSGIQSADIVGGSLTGTFSIDSTGKGTVTVPLAADSLTEGTETMTVTVQGQSASVSVLDTSKAPVATYSISSSSGAVDEGGVATFNLVTTNVSGGTSVSYTMTGISSSDIGGLSLTGSAVVDSSGRATISVPISADNFTEGAETLTLSIQGQTASVTINDTSKSVLVPTYAISALSSSVSEGGIAQFSLATTNVSPGTGVRYLISGLNQSDINGGELSGSAMVSANGSAQISIPIAADSLTEGTEVLMVSVGDQSATMTVLDTSLSPATGTTVTNNNGIVVGGNVIINVNSGNTTNTITSINKNIKVFDMSVTNDITNVITKIGDITRIEGNQENNTLVGSDAIDRLFGGGGSDRFYSSKGNDVIDGGDGTDAVTFRGKSTDFRVEKVGGNWLVRDTRSDAALNQGEDTLTGVERVAFEDKVLALDIDGVAGKAYRVYKAAFNRDPMAGDTAGLGYWIDRMDNAMDLIEVSARFVDSNEFRTLYGTNPTNDQFLTKLYTNVLGRQPEASGYNWWLNELNTNPEKTKAKVLADFAESPENQTGVLGLIGSGITYEPWVG